MASQLSLSVLGRILSSVCRLCAPELTERLRPAAAGSLGVVEAATDPTRWERLGRGRRAGGYFYTFTVPDTGLYAELRMAADDRTMESLRLWLDVAEATALARRGQPATVAIGEPRSVEAWESVFEGKRLATAILASPEREMRLLGTQLLGRAAAPDTVPATDLKLAGIRRPGTPG